MKHIKTGMIGQNISRSRFSAAMELLGNEYGWTFDFESIDTAAITNFEFHETVVQIKDAGWNGVVVTHPFKQVARQYVGTAMNAKHTHLQSCNLILFEPHSNGYNTDHSGFLTALELGEIKAEGNVTLIGAGGVAAAIADALVVSGANVGIFDIDAAKSQALANSIGAKARALSKPEVATYVRSCKGLINATPIGMAEYPGSSIPFDWIGPQDWAFDAVYTPVWTEFLSHARKKRLKCLTGFDLFRAMAVDSFAYLTQEQVNPKLMVALDRLKPV